MTIVVAGYNYSENIWRDLDDDKERKGMRREGLFAVADSIITSHSSQGHSPLLSGYKKIKEVPISCGNPTLWEGSSVLITLFISKLNALLLLPEVLSRLSM